MPNGVPTPGQPGQPPIPNGISHYQANGAPATNGPTMGTPSQQPMILTQRPGQAPGAGQLRGPNGAPFQSPTMAQQVAGGPPGAHMTGPMNASQPPRMPMPPPNTPGMGGQQQQQQHQHQQAPFQHLGSQPGSPAQNNLTAPSPRQMPRQTLPEIRQLQETELNQAIMKINPTRLAEIKAEAGCGNKDLPSMTLEDKVRTIFVQHPTSAQRTITARSHRNRSRSEFVTTVHEECPTTCSQCRCRAFEHANAAAWSTTRYESASPLAARHAAAQRQTIKRVSGRRRKKSL